MLRLFQLPRAWGIANISPPCAKLEAWLRLCKIPYDIGPLDLSAAPKGKLPYVQDDSETMGDATLLIDTLKARYQVDPDAQLTPEQRAIGVAFRRMLKEDFYWAVVYFRWRLAGNFAVMERTFVEFLPQELPMAARLQFVEGVKANLLAQLQQQGMGRHTPHEVASLGIADLQAVADFLNDKPYFFGQEPTSIDATVFAALTNVIDAPIASPLKVFAAAQPNLVAYTRRLEQQLFPELAAAR